MGPQTGLSQLLPFDTMVIVYCIEIADLPGEESSDIRGWRSSSSHPDLIGL
jgi:hypothetical protein